MIYGSIDLSDGKGKFLESVFALNTKFGSFPFLISMAEDFMNELKEIFARESPVGWRLVLSNGKNTSTRGRTFNFKVVWINISIGEDIEILHTLLHEITHTHLGGRHNDRFFKFMIQLDKKYGVSPNDIYRVEDYYPTALKEYQEEYGRS